MLYPRNEVSWRFWRRLGLLSSNRPSFHVTSLWPRIRCGFLPRGQTTTLLVSVRSTCSHPAESRQALYSDGHQCLWPNVPGNTPRPGHTRWLLLRSGLYHHSIFFQRPHPNSWGFQQQARKETYQWSVDRRAFMWYQEHQWHSARLFPWNARPVCLQHRFSTCYTSQDHLARSIQRCDEREHCTHL